jgi:hypothetical protein
MSIQRGRFSRTQIRWEERIIAYYPIAFRNKSSFKDDRLLAVDDAENQGCMMLTERSKCL